MIIYIIYKYDLQTNKCCDSTTNQKFSFQNSCWCVTVYSNYQKVISYLSSQSHWEIKEAIHGNCSCYNVPLWCIITLKFSNLIDFNVFISYE